MAKLLNINWRFVNYSPHRFHQHVFEMPSRCLRDVDIQFVNIFTLRKHNNNFKYANIDRQLPLPREGVGGGPLFLRSSFAVPSLEQK